MKDYNKDRLVFKDDEKRAIPWRKIGIGILAVLLIVLIVSFFQPEPDTVSFEIELPKLQ